MTKNEKTYKQLQDELKSSHTEIKKLQQQLKAHDSAIAKLKKTEKALLESEQKLKTITEEVADGMVIASAKGTLYVNKRLLDMLGYSEAELLKTNLFNKFLPPQELKKMEIAFRKRLSGGGPLHIYKTQLICKDGKIIPVEISAALIQWQGKPASLALIHNITDRIKIEGKLQFREKLFQLITRMSTDFVKMSIENIDEGIHKALQSICEFAGVDRGYIFEFHDDEKKMSNTYEWCAKGMSSQKAILQDLNLDTYSWTVSHFLQGKVLYCPKVAELPPESEPVKSEFISAGIKSFVCVPLVFATHVNGCLGFDSIKTEKTWSEEIIMLLQLAAESIANALERRKAEKELRETQEKFFKVFHTSQDPMALSSIKEGIFMDVNDAFLESLGYKREEVINKSSKGLNVWADHKKRDKVLKILQQQGYCKDFEVEVRTKSGEIIYGLFSASVIELASGPILYTMMKNITKRKQAEEALRESEDKFRTIAEQSIMGIAIVQETRVVYINQAYADMIGYTVQEILDWGPGELFNVLHPDDKDYVIEQVMKQEAFTIGYIVHYNYRTVLKNGEIRVLSIYSKTMPYQGKSAYFVITSNITARQKAEESLKISEERLSLALKATNDGLWDWNIPEETAYFSPRYYKMLGYAPDELHVLYKSWKDLIHPEDVENTNSKLEACLNGERDSFEMEFRIKTKQGAWKWILSRGRIVKYDEQGKPDRIVGTYTDISQQKEIEERLLHSEKMEAIGQLAGGIAHDFNNQLSSIVGYIELLHEGVHDRPELEKYTDNIMRATKRASDLTTQLLAFARKGKYQSVPVDVHSTIREVISLLQHSIDKMIVLKTHFHASPPYILGDPTQLQNALLNLALNARDAMPKGGELSFATSIVILDKQFCKQSSFELRPGDYLKIEVTDSGWGMDQKTQKHIFEPFFTTKPDGKGTGMGMAAVYGTVKNHKGAIEVHSKTGKGTTIQLYFPHITSKPDRKQQADERIKLAKGSTHVLLIDDEEMIRDVGSVMLNSLGYKASLCSNGAEAIEFFKNAWQDIDLVILDMVMPRMSGMETFLELKKINPHVKAILSSGYGADSEVQKILNAGVIGFIQKPFRRKDLSEKIAEVLAKKG